MMIKLFLITLFCATLVFADSPVQNFQELAREKPVNGFLSRVADHYMGHGSSLVRRSAQEEKGGGGEGRAGGRFGAGFGIGFEVGGGIGGGAGRK